MDFKIYYDALYEKVDELVSQHAKKQFSEDGTSLYDSLTIPSNERQRVIGFIDMAVSALLQRLGDVACVDMDDSSVLHFFLPDLQPDFEARIEAAINLYLVNYACAYWFDRVAKDNVEVFLNIAKGAIDNAATLARTRRKPVRGMFASQTTDDSEEDTDDEDNG